MGRPMVIYTIWNGYLVKANDDDPPEKWIHCSGIVELYNWIKSEICAFEQPFGEGKADDPSFSPAH